MSVKASTLSATIFWPDPEIFDETEFDFDTLEHRFREMAFLNKGIKITLEDQRAEQEKKLEFYYEGGVKQFVEHLNRNKEALHKNIIYFSAERDDSEVEIAMQYTDAYKC